jgi:hypothetical protein
VSAEVPLLTPLCEGPAISEALRARGEELDLRSRHMACRRDPRTIESAPMSNRPADCPQKHQAGVTRACGAVMPDLVDLP